MTILGATLAGPDLAYLWVDDELYLAGSREPAAFCNKMAINPAALCVGAGRGYRGIICAADEVLLACSNFDEAVPAITIALRRNVMASAGRFDRDPDAFLALSYAVAGYSARAGRVLTYRFTPIGFFAAELLPQILGPEIERDEHWRARSLGDVTCAAREQMEAFRLDGHPGAGIGTLTVAEVRPDFIGLQSFPDFDVEATARRIGEMETKCSSTVF